jgi:gamma-glutamyltranspeptidase/glutathione hydrolase/leukotriene-C4 hydrolase
LLLGNNKFTIFFLFVSDVLSRNGTAVDAAIASLFCNGLINSHSMGIGGGSFWTIYLKERGEVVTLNARETAPDASTTNMYLKNPKGSSEGPFSSAVPGEVRGYWEAKQRCVVYILD